MSKRTSLTHKEELDLNQSFMEENNLSSIYFSASQLCKACDISRTMLIKLEKEGILTPHHTNPKTGYRWYDLFNVARLQQYQMLRVMGLTMPEIRSYLGFGDLSPEEILEKLQERLNIFQAGVEAYASRISKDKNLTFSLKKYPPVTCLCCTKTFKNLTDVTKAGYELHAEAVLRGYKLLSTTPLFSMRLSSAEDSFTSKICIPLEGSAEDYASVDDVETIDGGHMLTMLYYGGYDDASNLSDAAKSFFQHIQKENYKVSGPLRIYWVVSSYFGSQFQQDDYVFRFAIPVAP